MVTCNTENLTDEQFLKNCKEFQTIIINEHAKAAQERQRELSKERLFIHQNKKKVTKLALEVREHNLIVSRERGERKELIDRLERVICFNLVNEISKLRGILDDTYFREIREKRAAEAEAEREKEARRQAWIEKRQAFWERRQEYFDRMNTPREILIPCGGMNKRY